MAPKTNGKRPADTAAEVVVPAVEKKTKTAPTAASPVPPLPMPLLPEEGKEDGQRFMRMAIPWAPRPANRDAPARSDMPIIIRIAQKARSS